MALLCAVLLLHSCSASDPPKFAPNTNNVGGQMPNPSGNPAHGIMLLGAMQSSDECEAAANKLANATSWTYHHCNFPPAGSGNYSCHCYYRTDGRWAPAHESLIDSGFIKSAAPFKCATNFDCQLNGDCIQGKCTCLPAWKGDQCERLNLQPALPNSGLQLPTTSSWGGSILKGEKDDLYHMFAAIFEHNCGLSAWRPNSALGHATSRTAEGPYSNMQIIKPHFAHEPVALRARDGTILIWHIGSGANETGPGSNYATNCTNGCTGRGHSWQPGLTFYGPTTILHSNSFTGPWSSLDIGNCSNLPGCTQVDMRLCTRSP